jgi:hypothetical protein
LVVSAKRHEFSVPGASTRGIVHVGVDSSESRRFDRDAPEPAR